MFNVNNDINSTTFLEIMNIDNSIFIFCIYLVKLLEVYIFILIETMSLVVIELYY